MVTHALHYAEHYNVGPHTISFPRLRPASGVTTDPTWLVSDQQFKRWWPSCGFRAVHGLILTAREQGRAAGERCWAFAFRRSTPEPHRAGRIPEAGDTQVMDASISSWATSARWTW